MGIDTEEVLKASGTKWNFLPFRPGLVGGHCIGVDPFYLTYKAQQIGYHPEIILAGRRINDSMGAYVARQVILLMTKKKNMIADSRVLVLGLTFKENCPDLRNTKVIDIINELKNFSANVEVYDPWINTEEAHHEYNVKPLEKEPATGLYDAVVLAVGHREFKDWGIGKIKQLLKSRSNGVVYDIKSLFGLDETDGRL